MLNEEADKISLVPIEIAIREKIGFLIEPNNLNEISKIILKLDDKSRAEEIRNIRSQTVFNIGKSASVGAEYIEKILNS